MAEHTDEPHVHTITFTDNAGKAYSVDVDCPSPPEEFVDRLAATGTEKVNGLAVDGKPMSFEGVFMRLGEAGRLDLLGAEYETPENLVRVLIAMGAGGAEIEEEVTDTE